MPRLVRLSATGPIKIDPKTLDPEKPIWICACGLSATFPFCDGTHKNCAKVEQPGTLTIYGPDRTPVEHRPDAAQK
jgi:CDGSH-type Zn-finger protein